MMESADIHIPNPSSLLTDEIESIKSVLGNLVSEEEIIKILNFAGNNVDRAVNMLLDYQDSKHQVASAQLKNNCINNLNSLECKDTFKKKDAKADVVKDSSLIREVNVESDHFDVGLRKDENLTCETEFKTESVCKTKISNKESSMDSDVICTNEVEGSKKDPIFVSETKLQDRECHEMEEGSGDNSDILESRTNIGNKRFDRATVPNKVDCNESEETLAISHCVPYLNAKPIRAMRPTVMDRRIQVAAEPDPAEFMEFPEEDDWWVVGRTYVAGLSTCSGRRKIDENEIVYFSFPKMNLMKQHGKKWVKANDMSEIVRFSTKKSGQIGRLPPQWSKCLVPLVQSNKVMVKGRCVIAPSELSLMQEIILYVNFYIHSSIFTEGDTFSWKLQTSAPADHSSCPLPTLFKLLKLTPSQKAEFTPDELDTRKRTLSLRGYNDDDDDDSGIIVGLEKRRKCGPMNAEQNNDDQAIDEASLNKLIGTAEMYDLEEAKPPTTLMCNLWPYQKQALYWMTEREKGLDAEKTLHPCWAAYNICDKRASMIYVNIFTGEATTRMPSATESSRGGILADAMGLGKTVMTIALVLSKPRGKQEDYEKLEVIYEESNEMRTLSSIKGGTLIVCPMALLGQWKDELETHSKPGSISVFVHYGGDRTTDPREIAKHDVVLTTYGVLQASYKHVSANMSIFHKINWYRVVLDEAHTIKSPKAQVSQSAYALTSYCRWCLTGTPLQNNLEDLYSLLCFLHVQPWCNWEWWNKLIQRPYENGEERGLKLVKGILRSIMLRRTKETKDKDGRPILVLPPANIQVVYCEPSQAERDFYEALFNKSKVRFEQFSAQGKILQNYASILELLLRLRQCCNHPFLIVNQKDQQNADLNNVAQRFLESRNRSSVAPPEAYVHEMIEGLKRGEATECPICLESASDDPVITPCAHRMCRECLLGCWSTPSGGPCPICRKDISTSDLILCPSELSFQVDVQNDWKDSSKVSELIKCINTIEESGLGEKCIVFSQWTSFLDLLEIPLNKKGIQFLRFDGKLTQKGREKVLKEFNECTNKQVLLMSLKAGGVGLNLTAASNVFLMDPWWNPAVEEQAIMRIHRIGQKRQVVVRRFIVKNTVEERMQQVQAKKQRMIAGALTDDEVRNARIEELKMFFR